ncbi:MAG TPA: efflux RND transporter periplasmic adaptor subunit [Burkholderiales bacterium]
MTSRKIVFAAIAAAIVGAVAIWMFSSKEQSEKPAAKAGEPKPALSVTAVSPQPAEWPQTLAANGNIAAWQEAVIGSEISGQRLTEVLANVGDRVKKGQVLARVDDDTITAELAQSKAALAEAQAMAAEATANADRARQMGPLGAFTKQQINQYLTAEKTAASRVVAARAKVQADELRLAHTRVVAPDDGVISARAATVGSLTQPGQELFRLIRGGRLEWRAEVIASELGRILPGLAVHVVPPGAAPGTRIEGRVRMVAPTVDPQTRNAIVYVDLPADSPARAGMFARGEFQLGSGSALTLPQAAVLLRDGFSYVHLIGADGKVAQVKVSTGRRSGDRVEITGGLDAGARVVASGGAFLADGDAVRVVESQARQ